MLVFPQWRPVVAGDGCRVPRWMPVDRFAPYIARPVPIPPSPPQIEDEDSSGSTSPERSSADSSDEGCCGWRGCRVRFPNVARLSAHVARTHAHAHSDGLFYCGWKGCARPQRGFNARYKMLVHIRTHTNERPHACHQCSKSFSRAENLKIHLRSHSGEKPYVCPYEGCGKAYSNSSDRFKHTRTHTVEKPYFCKVPGCNKRYTDPSSLRKHVKTFKHFVPKDDIETQTETSPRDIPYTSNALGSPLRMSIEYSSPRSDASPTIPYNPLPESPVSLSYPPLIDPLHYTRPLEPIYPIRIPTHDISYLDYKPYNGYKGYYSSELAYPVLRPSVIEKAFTYEEHPRLEVYEMDKIKDRQSSEVFIMDEEMPLNLKCNNRQVELVRNTDLPLDLSTKS